MNKDSTQHQPGSSSSFIVPIRAPLTIDSDSEYYLSSCNSSTTSSVVDISSRFNDDFGTCPHDEIVLEQSRFDKCELIRPFVKYPHGNEVINEIFRPIVKCPDGDNVNDFGHLDENEIFRPIVKCPDGNEVKDWGDLDKNEVFRPIVKCPDGKNVDDCSGSGKNEIFRPFVKYQDGNDVRDCGDFGKNEVFRPFVKYPDGDNLKICNGFGEKEIFRPIVKCPDGNDVNDFGHLDENEIFRPIVKCPDGDNVKDCGGFDENEIFRPIVRCPDGKNVDDCSDIRRNDIFKPFVKYQDGDSANDFGGFDKSEIFRHIVKCQDGNDVKECGGSDKSDIFRPFVKYPNGDNVKDCGGLDKNEIFRPIVKCPDGNEVRDCGGFDKGGDFGSFVKYRDGDNVKDCGGFDKNDVFRPFVKDPDGDNVKDCGGFDKGGVFRPFVKCTDRNESRDAKDYDGSDKVGVFRPIVKFKYPYGDNAKDCGCFDKGGVFRPFVNESSSSSSSHLGVPVARLSGDCDSGSDVDSVDGVVECVIMEPKVRTFCADEGDDELQVEGVFSGDDSSCISELNQLTKDNETISGSEQEVVFDGYGNQSKKTVATKIEMAPEFQIFGFDEGDDTNGSMSGCISDEGCKVECLNLVHDLSELNEMSKTVNESEPEVYRTEFKNTLSEMEGVHGSTRCSAPADTIEENGYIVECLNEVVKLSEPDEPSVNLESIVATISGCEQKESLVKTQPVKSNFLNLLRFLGLLNEFDSHLTILAIGKTGIGKSATINSIFGENKASTNAFDPGTTTTQQIVGTIEGINLRVIDTPGLKSSPFERSHNLKILKSIKRLAKKHTPDVVLYVDRLDTHTRGDDDSHLLRLITSSLGSSIWRNCIIALTHASSSPTDESFRGFVFQRCRLLQEKIHKHGCTNDEHMVNPVWLVENHPSYKHDESRLLEVSDYLRHNIVLDDGLDGLVCFDRANEPLSKLRAVVKCSVERRKAYFEEYSYRVKLLGTKHWYVACRLYS